MSTKAQIKQSFKRDGTEYNQIEYSCNCGWLDFTHLYPGSDNDPHKGAVNLWNQIKNGDSQPPAKAYYCGGADQVLGQYRTGVRMGCRHDNLARFKDTTPWLGNKERTGFRVIFKMDMGANFYKFRPRILRQQEYLVRYGLTIEQKKRVAISIFMEISKRFEDLQGYVPLSRDSSFSKEDLVSNIIGFYIAIGHVRYEDVRSICGIVPPEIAELLWPEDGLGSTNNKNYRFEPFFEQDKISGLENNPCAGEPIKFPSIFQTIKPIDLGILHMHMPNWS
ncbi:hypothetical protein [Bartonella sp. HY038]|uniref:hypothetical protein n=1 Tax=Bartonella sp. HY038 TaxID=2759660 RepID=UPI0015FA055D|nr:hypothetical protein [Bartonella sp. HY038]